MTRRNASDPGYLASFYAPSANESHPLLAVAEFPYVNGSEAGVWVVSCSIIAHWVPTVLTVSPSEIDFVESNITEFEPFRFADIYRPAVGPAIRMQDDWLPFLSPEADITLPNGTVAKTTQIERLLSVWMATRSLGNTSVLAFDPGSSVEGTESIIMAARHLVQTFFGSIVADALSRAASSGASYAVLSRNDTTVVVTDLGLQQTNSVADTVYEWSRGVSAAPNITGVHRPDDGSKTPQQLLDGFHQLTVFDFEVERYGYGSGKVGSTMRFAYSVMFIYFAIVGGYFLYIMMASFLRRGKTVPTVRGWDDVQELIVLAWNSKLSPKLSRSSVEVKQWRVEVAIRADTTGRIQLTTGELGFEASGGVSLTRSCVMIDARWARSGLAFFQHWPAINYSSRPSHLIPAWQTPTVEGKNWRGTRQSGNRVGFPLVRLLPYVPTYVKWQAGFLATRAMLGPCSAAPDRK